MSEHFRSVEVNPATLAGRRNEDGVAFVDDVGRNENDLVGFALNSFDSCDKYLLKLEEQAQKNSLSRYFNVGQFKVVPCWNCR